MPLKNAAGIAGRATATALAKVGYKLRETADPRDNTAHRFVRGTSKN